MSFFRVDRSSRNASIARAHQIMTARIMERGLTSGRLDDNEEAIRKRLVTYRESTMPIIKEFEARGKLREVNSNQTIGACLREMSLAEVAWNHVAFSHQYNSRWSGR